MGRFLFVVILIAAFWAIDAYAFGGRYREAAMQEGKRFSWDVQYRLKKLGI